MPKPIALPITDGTRIVVPDSLDLITPYVLLEQQDWFEDEIKLLRRLLRPGQRVIDIGANHGVYALSMARTVGPSGSVWAFEPASGTAALLAEGIAVNGFKHVVLERSALSDECRTAQLGLNANSELNALLHGAASSIPSEAVRVVTLDECLRRYGWAEIDFVKIDAEGEEANILAGGSEFLATLNPLIQYEVKAGADHHLHLVRAFADRGFDSYRLVPGLEALIPFAADAVPDGYLLNLFCCKKERAAQLAAQGRLVTLPPDADALAADGRRAAGDDDARTLDVALTSYRVSRDATLPLAVRFGALERSFHLLKSLCEERPERLRLASLARVARDYGARTIAVAALNRLLHAIRKSGSVDATEPFLAPSERFDSIPPGGAILPWALASVLEEIERLGSFSSFYTGNAALKRLQLIHSLGFASEEMQRRLRLVTARFGAASKPAAGPGPPGARPSGVRR